jgi:hypothetical protein
MKFIMDTTNRKVIILGEGTSLNPESPSFIPFEKAERKPMKQYMNIEKIVMIDIVLCQLAHNLTPNFVIPIQTSQMLLETNLLANELITQLNLPIGLYSITVTTNATRHPYRCILPSKYHRLCLNYHRFNPDTECTELAPGTSLNIRTRFYQGRLVVRNLSTMRSMTTLIKQQFAFSKLDQQ